MRRLAAQLKTVAEDAALPRRDDGKISLKISQVPVRERDDCKRLIMQRYNVVVRVMLKKCPHLVRNSGRSQQHTT